jgi:hypothetical protein
MTRVMITPVRAFFNVRRKLENVSSNLEGRG